ncbi:hypothetical protein [Bacillus piscicola]|uniref:hypothetical protein n=1 Tax=Bacillus piscicola TaxID=1632684 RepID=UPI001F08D1F4|nr:hypothetical protein [Bacillus piscicola]
MGSDRTEMPTQLSLFDSSDNHLPSQESTSRRCKVDKGDVVKIIRAVDDAADTLGYFELYKNKCGIVTCIKPTSSKDTRYMYAVGIWLDKEKKEVFFYDKELAISDKGGE